MWKVKLFFRELFGMFAHIRQLKRIKRRLVEEEGNSVRVRALDEQIENVYKRFFNYWKLW